MRKVSILGCALAVLMLVPPAWSQGLIHGWSQNVGDADQQYGMSAAIDGSGNVIVTGMFEGTVDFGGGPLTCVGYSDVFVVKYDPNGNHLWSQRFGDTLDQYAYSVATDGSGNVIVTGYFDGTMNFGGGVLTSAGGDDIFVAKFDAAGNHLWSQRFGDTIHQLARSTAVDDSGNVIVTGHFLGTVDFGGDVLTSAGYHDIFVAKFDAAGNHLWSQRFGDASNHIGWSVAVDNSGNVILTGYFDGTVNFGGGVLTSVDLYDIFIAKFDAAGNHLWSQRFGDALDQFAYSVAIDGSGNVIVTGRFLGAVDFGSGMLPSAGSSDIYVAKFDAAGNHLWSQRFGDTDYQVGYGIAVDNSGNVIVTGYFQGNVDFGSGLLPSAGSSDIYVAKFDVAGNHLWSQRFGDTIRQHARSAAVDGSGNVIVTGYFQGSVDFGGGALTSAGSMDIFVAKFLAEPEPIAIPFDIKPGACPNLLNAKTSKNPPKNARSIKGGVLQTAVLGTAVLDVNDLDVSSLRLEGVMPVRHAYEDVATPVVGGDACDCTTGGPDGFTDLTLKFERKEIVAALGEVSDGDVRVLTLTGQMLDGTPVEATDCVTILMRGQPPPVIESNANNVVLGPAVPNPFNPVTQIRYYVPEDAHVQLIVYDVRGEFVETLVDGTVSAGEHITTWNAKGVPSGVYFYRLAVGEFKKTRKMIMLK